MTTNAEESRAIELFFDALDRITPDNGYYDRDHDIVDMRARDIVTALLAAGWRVPGDG